MLVKPQTTSLAKIKVVGIGGGGGNALNNMITNYDIEGVEFIAVNTDAQALNQSHAEVKLRIGDEMTRGLGSGGNPTIGKKSAEESVDLIHEHLAGADMVFVTAGMGGGTGTGAAPVVSGIAKNLGALTVAIVTKPFSFEGKKRLDTALKGIQDLRDKVDTLIVIPNQKLLEVTDKKVSFLDGMKMVDDVLSHAVKSIAHLITQAGLINVDFADVRAIMEDAGTALMGMGQATGENRAKEAATMAIESPLLEISIDGAKGILFNVIGGKDLGMFEVDQAAQVISEQADNDANIIFGATIDPELGDELRITVLATGFDHDELMSKQASYNNLKRSSSRNRVNNSSGVQTSSQSSDLETQDNSENQGPSREMNHKKSPSKRDASYKSSFSENMIDDSEEEDLDTPSFLRRKKEY